MFKKLIASLALCALVIPYTAIAQEVSQPNVGLSKDVIYFVFPDRYRNGDTSNDLAGGITSDPTYGYDPTSTAHFHGGDLKGLTGSCQPGDDGLARIKSLGFTAVWMTPLVTQVDATSGGAGYHGYWGKDFLNVDPHLGTNEDLLALSACAKKLGLKLILDIVTNHTGDVVQYADKRAYIPEDLKSAKNPAWLNKLENYHNSGSISNCWGVGRCEQIGDFYSLDDLATEKEEVYKGWIDVYGAWIKKYGFTGFRVDTARHVDDNFFKNWSPGIQEAAKSVGINDFTIYGEVWDVNPMNLVSYVREKKIQTVLDFAFQRTATQFASGYSDAAVLANLFDVDDQYTTAQSSASNLVTFLGNHDMGRVGFIIPQTQINAKSDLLERTKLAHALMYFSRGIPTVYYGDEVGMTGSGNGGDQRARQDMFETKITAWKSEARIGGQPVGDGNSFTNSASHPLAIYLTQLAQIRAAHPALANGQMQLRSAKGSTLVLSKYDPVEKIEYLVAFNNSKRPSTASFSTSSNGQWKNIFGSAQLTTKGATASLEIPAFGAAVFAATTAMPAAKITPGVLKTRMDFLTGMLELSAPMKSTGLNRVEFSVKAAGSAKWVNVGTDFNAPYRIYLSPTDYKYGSKISVRATAMNIKGDRVAFKQIEAVNK
ncbi:MAG: alpha-amylase family glycosyl hydrolase [Candidatus Planktophila sp.]